MTPCDRCARVQAENRRLRDELKRAAEALCVSWCSKRNVGNGDHTEGCLARREALRSHIRAELSRSGP